jgi:hypothetical protein
MSYQWGAANNEKAAMTGLKEEVARVADRELRENKSTREQMLEQFREWIRKNQDICNCRTGSKNGSALCILHLALLRFGFCPAPKSSKNTQKNLSGSGPVSVVTSSLESRRPSCSQASKSLPPLR